MKREKKIIRICHRPQSALGVIKSTAVWLQQLHFQCVMYFNNDSARWQIGLSSRSLSQLILLLLTTLTGRRSRAVACLPLFPGRRDVGEDGQRKKEKKKQRELLVCFHVPYLTFLRLSGCVLMCMHAGLCTSMCCGVEFPFVCLCGYVPAWTMAHVYHKCLFS